jgi:hypothetical protein
MDGSITKSMSLDGRLNPHEDEPYNLKEMSWDERIRDNRFVISLRCFE